MPDRDTGLAAAGTLASAMLVASHCVGVVLLLLFGPTVAALSLLGALERYRPLFIAAGFGFWGFGLYRVYVRADAAPRETLCGRGLGPALRRLPTLLWVGLAILIFAVALPSLAAYLAGS